MDLRTTILFSVLLIVIVLVIVLLNWKRKKEKKKLLQTLSALAEKSNCKITEYELWIKGLIGIDQNAHHLFFMKKTDNDELWQEINLMEIQKCRIGNTNRIVSYKESNQTVTEKVELILVNSDPKKPDVSLEFYNSSFDNLTLNGEIQLTEKWSEIVNKNIAGIIRKK